MGHPVYFEIQATDVDRARAFYSAAFDWEYKDRTAELGVDYWAVSTGSGNSEGMNGAILKRPAPAPASEQGTNSYVVTLEVSDYDATHEKIMSNGGTVALPKFPMPGDSWRGYYIDTEGNTFGVLQWDSSAG